MTAIGRASCGLGGARFRGNVRRARGLAVIYRDRGRRCRVGAAAGVGPSAEVRQGVTVSGTLGICTRVPAVGYQSPDVVII